MWSMPGSDINCAGGALTRVPSHDGLLISRSSNNLTQVDSTHAICESFTQNEISCEGGQRNSHGSCEEAQSTVSQTSSVFPSNRATDTSIGTSQTRASTTMITYGDLANSRPFPTPYHTTVTPTYCPIANGETGSVTGSRNKRHFKRRVAQYHSNQRTQSKDKLTQHSSYSLPPTPAHSTMQLSNSNACLSPCGSVAGLLPDHGNYGAHDISDRRSLSLEPNLSSCKSFPTKTLLPDTFNMHHSVTENNLKHKSDGCNRALSIPLLKTDADQTLEINNLETHPILGAKSHSHQQLSSSSIADVNFANSDYVMTNGHQPISYDRLVYPATPNSCRSVSTERTSKTVERWYHKYYTGLSNSETQPMVLMRSPIGVLAACRGKLHLKIEGKNNHISVHVIEAKGIRTTNSTACSTFVEVAVVPDKAQLFTQRTPAVHKTANPKYQHTVNLDLNRAKHGCRRILITVYSRQAENGESEFLGGMSFGIPGILSKEQISGWYYILNESVSRKKHLKAPHDPSDTPDASVNPNCIAAGNLETVQPVSSFSSATPLSMAQKASTPIALIQPTPSTREAAMPAMCSSHQSQTVLSPMHVYQSVISRGSKGFGFTLSGNGPVTVCNVERGSPAQQSGIVVGDCILAVNQMDVSKTPVDQVVQLFRTAKTSVVVTIGRQPRLELRLPPLSKPTGNKTFSNLLQKTCFSPVKKSPSNGLNSLKQDLHSTTDSDTTTFHSAESVTPASPQTTHLLLNASEAAAQLGSSNLWSPLLAHGLSPIRNSKTEFHLSETFCNGVSRDISNHHSHRRTSLDQPRKSKISIAHSDFGTPCHKPPHLMTNIFRPNTVIPANSTFHADSSFITNPLLFYPMRQPFQPSGAPPVPRVDDAQTSNRYSTTSSIVDYLKYVSHVKRVDFRIHPPRLEHHGCLNLLEANRCSRVDLLMFPDLLLIAQRAPNRYFTVIKDPIYNAKICYVNIPSYATDQLILQYIDCSNRKQIVHFQGSDVRDWLNRIQGHMIYNGNWWMDSIHCTPVDFR